MQKVWYDGLGVIRVTTGQKIKEARKKAGLTQKELGQKLGLSFQAIAQWENDLRNPKFETLKKIADALGVNIDSLLDESTLAQIEANVVHPSLVDKINARMDILSDTEHLRGYVTVDELAEMVSDVKKMFEQASHKELMEFKKIADVYNGLNPDGQRVALERLDELAQLPKYQRQPAQEGQQTEQSTPGGAEDKTDQA